MTRSELILRLTEKHPHLYPRDIEKIIDTIFGEISDALANGNRVELRGFGAFAIKERAGRIGRNPRTGESVQVKPKKSLAFKAGKGLKQLLNGETITEKD